MWQAIRDNKRRSRLLIGVMGMLLVGLGALIGLTWVGPEGAALGAVAALVIWLIMLLVALTGGEQVVLAAGGARQVKKEDAPRLFNVVEEMTIASGLGTPPKVYIINDDAPNAFAAGRKPESACVAVTSGLLKRLTRDELQGVIAHELAHIKNLDVRFMTIATVMLGSIAILSDVFFRSLWFGGGGGRRRGSGGGQAQLIILAATVIVAILAPICAQLLYFACSRKREYLADASASQFTRYPEGLASALQKISTHLGRNRKGVPRVLAPMYIVNPLQAASSSKGWGSTHPPTAKRIEILRAMGGNAGWAAYEQAYGKVVGSGACLDARTLAADEGGVPARAATDEVQPKQEAVARAREVGDLLNRMMEFLVIACACGVRIKVPSEYGGKSIKCTRCGREHGVPAAEVAAVATAAGLGVAAAAAAAGTKDATAAADSLRYARKGDGWESFKCACGKVQQLSPSFKARSVRCRACRRKIEIAPS